MKLQNSGKQETASARGSWFEDESSLCRSLVEESEAVLFVADGESRLVYLNKAGRRILGKESFSRNGLEVCDLFDPAEAEVIRKICFEVLTEKRSTVNYRGILRSGDSCSVVADLKPLLDKDGQAVGIQGGIRDISPLSQIEQDLAEQKERLSTILRSIGVGLVIVDRQRRVFYQNELIGSRFGRAGDNRCFALYGRSEPCENCVLEQVLSGQELGTTLVCGEDRDWNESTVEILSSPVRDKAGQIIGALEVVLDVTEKNRLAERVNILAKVVENMQEGVVIVTLDGQIIYANDSFAEQAERAIAELEQVKLTDLFVPLEGEWTSEGEWFERLTKGFFGECECRRPDGENLTVHLSTFQIVGENQRTNAVVAVSNDLTERKRLESDLIQSSKLAALGELISGITHELNNPLGSIMGYSQLMLNAIDRDEQIQVPEKFKRNLRSVLNESERASKIIRNLLTFARRHQADKRPVDINEVIQNTFELRAYDLKLKNVRVDLQFSPDLPLILADYNQLQQVFLNLINNAVHVMTAERRERTITVQTREGRRQLDIRFSDSGPGIPSKNLHKIFDPFFTTKEVGEGTGLGLSICLGIIKEHGGTIQVQSPPGQGAVFVIGLPIVTIKATDASVNRVPAPSSRRYKGTILVVDDESSMRIILEEYLGAEGFDVICEGDGLAALKCLATREVDLVVTDVKMPRMDGKELYREIKRQYPRLAERTVFLTGDFLSKETIRFVESTGRLVLKKPVSLPTLLARVTGILDEGGR